MTRRAKRSGLIAASSRPSESGSGSRRCVAGRAGASSSSPRVALHQQLHPLVHLAHELRRPQHARPPAEAEDPRDHLARVGVGGLEYDSVRGRVVDLGRWEHGAGVAEVALDEPVDPVRYPDAGGALRLAELPVGARGVDARVEALGAGREVVLGLRGVADLAADARQPEDADVVALVRVPDEVELPAAEEKVVRVDAPALLGVAPDRVVVEQDRLAAEDRRLDLRQPLRQLAAAGTRGDPERHRAVLGSGQRRRLAPRELLEREAQRLGVGELAAEQRQRGAKRPELGVRELDRRQVEVLGRQRVVLSLVVALGRLVHLELDPQRVELRPVGVEAPREGVVVHRRVALDLLLDLEGGDGPPLRHQERDQRELADQLLGVLGHPG